MIGFDYRNRPAVAPFVNHPSLFFSTGAIFPKMKIWQLCICVIVALGLAQLMAETPSTGRDINAALAAHHRHLLELHDAVVVCVGVLVDGKQRCVNATRSRSTSV